MRFVIQVLPRRVRHSRDPDDARARAAEEHAIATDDPDAWEVAADAWEEAGDIARADRLRDGGSKESADRFKRSVKFFRRTEGRHMAQIHAEAERFARRRGFATEVRNEVERYQDAYGYSPENAETEARTDFVVVLLRDEDGVVLESIGFVESTATAMRWWGAELAYNRMPPGLRARARLL